MLLPSEIHPNARQPRRNFDEAALQSLADSIRTAGLMQPIVVRSDPAGGFEIVAGERRWRAADRIGLERVPAIVRSIDDQRSAELALIENLQREDLNPVERATAFQQLIDDFGLRHQEIAECVGLERSTVTNHLRLLELDDPTLDAVRSATLTLAHAKILLGITNLSRRKQLASAAVKRGWSVRDLDRRAKAKKQEAGAPGPKGNDRKAPRHQATGEKEPHVSLAAVEQGTAVGQTGSSLAVACLTRQ